jgi:hypothetical protein
MLRVQCEFESPFVAFQVTPIQLRGAIEQELNIEQCFVNI